MKIVDPVIMQSPESPKTRQHFPLLLSGACVAGASDAFCWGLYWQTQIVRQSNPLGTDLLSYHLGLTAYSLMALAVLLLSTQILQKSLKTKKWTQLHHDLFYTGILLGIVSIMTGFEFLFWMDWQYLNPIPYLLVKSAFSGVLVVFIIRIFRSKWLNPPPHLDESQSGGSLPQC